MRIDSCFPKTLHNIGLPKIILCHTGAPSSGPRRQPPSTTGTPVWGRGRAWGSVGGPATSQTAAVALSARHRANGPTAQSRVRAGRSCGGLPDAAAFSRCLAYLEHRPPKFLSCELAPPPPVWPSAPPPNMVQAKQRHSSPLGKLSGRQVQAIQGGGEEEMSAEPPVPDLHTRGPPALGVGEVGGTVGGFARSFGAE